MKAQYDPYIQRWYVKGIGYFDHLAEAEDAIKSLNQSSTMLIRINPNLRSKLARYAESKNVSASELIRQLIEKEMKDYE